MDILNPPRSYIEYRCLLYDIEDPNEIERLKKQFYKENSKIKEEIKDFYKWLYKARQDLSLPVENIEIEFGVVEPMMIYDVEYWRENGQIKQRKIYIPVD